MRSIILVLCFATNVFCQGWTLEFCASVPFLNRTIIHEADKLINKKIGTGLCGEFVVEVLSRAKVPLWKTKRAYIDITDLKYIKEGTLIYPGDIIIYDHHFAIIYTKLSPTEYTIIHQNFSGRLKYSHVGFGTVNLEEVNRHSIYRTSL